MALKRFVNGAEGEFFFQKRAPEIAPAWIETVELSFPSGRTADESSLRDAAQLAWIINLGCIDLNPHPVRADDLDHPDELRVDLDPVPGVPWAARPRRWRWWRRRCSTDVGLRRLAQDVGLARHPHQRAHRAAAGRSTRSAARRSRSRARSSGGRPTLATQQVVEGGAPRRLPRLQPERQGPHRRVGLLGPADARRAGLDAAALGRGRRRVSRRTSRSPRCRAIFAQRRRRRTPASTRRSGSLDALLELSARARGGGPGRRAMAAELPQAGGRAAARPAVTPAPRDGRLRHARGRGRAREGPGRDGDAGSRGRPRKRADVHRHAGRRRPAGDARRSRSSRSRGRPRRTTRWPASIAGRRATPRPPRPRAGRRAGGLDARPVHDVDPHPASTCSTCPRRSARRRKRSTPTTTRPPSGWVRTAPAPRSGRPAGRSRRPSPADGAPTTQAVARPRQRAIRTTRV